MTMELLAPAGGPEQLREAVRFGADAVYLAGERYGLRARAGTFGPGELERAVDFAHKNGVKVHVTVNALMHEEDVNDGGVACCAPGGVEGAGCSDGVMDGNRSALADCLRRVDAAGADAVIAGDLATIMLAREVAPDLAVHASTQLSCANHLAALALRDMGCSRIVLARELSVAEIAAIRSRVPDDLELEVFCHGAMCMAVSGRCLISAHLNARDANRGACSQPCRWAYTLEEEKRPGIHFPIEEDEHATTILSSKDLMMLDHLDDLARAGVASIKIEGRAKGAYYVATVVNAYRHVLDGEPAQAWLPELDAVSHRAYHTGFFYGAPDQSDAELDYQQNRILVGFVEECKRIVGDEAADDEGAGGWEATFTLRNRVSAGDEVEAVRPGAPVCRFVLDRPYDLDREEYVSTANRNGDRYRIQVPTPLGMGDVLRRQARSTERAR